MEKRANKSSSDIRDTNLNKAENQDLISLREQANNLEALRIVLRDNKKIAETIRKHFDFNSAMLDEPENSLSPLFQMQLIDYLMCSMKLGCQFVIATHSPFLLGLPGAKIYNLDDPEMPVVKWNELENIQIYYNFFRQHEKELSGK